VKTKRDRAFVVGAIGEGLIGLGLVSMAIIGAVTGRLDCSLLMLGRTIAVSSVPPLFAMRR